MKKDFYEELRGKDAKEKKYLIADGGFDYYFNGPKTLVEERDLAKVYSFAEVVQFLEKYDTDGTLKATPIDWEDKNDGLDILYEAFPSSESLIFDNDTLYYTIFDEVLSQKNKNLKQVKEKTIKLFAKKFHLS